MRQLHVFAQRRHGRHHFEGRTRRIQPVARAIQPRVGLLTLLRHSVEHRLREAHRRQQIAGRRVQHHGRPLVLAGLFELVAQNLRHFHFEPRIDRHVHVARPVEHLAHFGVLRVVAMPQQRNQLAIIVAQHLVHLAGLGILHLHQRGPVVVAAQPPGLIALHERCVGGAPALARPQVAQQVEHQPAERIMPAFAARAGLVDIDSQSLVIGAMFFQQVPIAGRQRQPVAVVDGALGNIAHHFLQPRVVLIAPRAIGLRDQRSRAHHRIAIAALARTPP